MYKKLIITQFMFYSKIPNLEERDKSQSGNLVGNSLIGICLILPNLGVFYGYSLNTLKYPEMGTIIFSCDKNE